MSKAKPVIIKKNRIVQDNLKILSCMNSLTQEDVIYKATANDFLKGKYPNLVILNKLNRLNNSSQTIARFSSMNSSLIELTSDAVTSLIGQKNYDFVFAALCSVISQELRIQGILSLLTKKQLVAHKFCDAPKVEKNNASTQTDQSCMSLLMKEKRCKGRKNPRLFHAKSYVVKDKLEKTVTKVVIHPKTVKCDVNIKKEQIKDEIQVTGLLDLKEIVDEDSNISSASTSNFSISSYNIPMTVLENPDFILNNVDRHTEDSEPILCTNITLFDGSIIKVNAKIEDNFHLVREDILNGMCKEDQQKLVIHQAYIDFKYCMERDEDNNLPIHRAVLENDHIFLKRQCIMLNKRGESIDEYSGSNLTALQMSIFDNSLKCTEVLLKYGADVMMSDNEGRSTFHLAAEMESGHLNMLIEYCRKNARNILTHNEDICEANWQQKSDEELADFLLHTISVMCDTQGYTPLMLASKVGIAKNVNLLIEMSPYAINKTMPNCGNTALYLAVAAACLDADNRGDRSKVAENYLKTVEMLIVNGADPYLTNNSGSNVNDLLQEFNISSLSLLIANKLTSVKFFNGNEMKNFDKYMLVKSSDGKVDITEMKKEPQIECELKLGPNKIVLYPKVQKNNEVTIIKEEMNPEPSHPYVVVSSETSKDSPKKAVTDKPKILQNIPIVSKVISPGCVKNKGKTDAIIVSKDHKIVPNKPVNNTKLDIKNIVQKKAVPATKLSISNTGQVRYLNLLSKNKPNILVGKKRTSDFNLEACCSKKRK